MSRRTKVLLIVSASVVTLAVALALAGPAIYRALMVSDVADTPEITLESSSSDEGAAAEDGESTDEGSAGDFSGSWSISQGSEAGYRVDEVLNGTDVTVTGRTPDVTGEVLIEGLSATEASIEVDVSTIATDNGSRDAYFRDQAMRVSQFPTASFVLTEAVTAASAPETGEPLKLELVGDLTLAGVTQSVTFPVQVQVDGQAAQVVGSIPVTFADYGVEAPSLGFVRVEPDGLVEFDLMLARAAQ